MAKQGSNPNLALFVAGAAVLVCAYFGTRYPEATLQAVSDTLKDASLSSTGIAIEVCNKAGDALGDFNPFGWCDQIKEHAVAALER